jgi:hypothetical protein
MKGNDDVHRRLTRGRERFKHGELLTVKFRQPSHELVYLRCWRDFCILSIGTNRRGTTSSLVHVGFGVWCLCRVLALKARLSG